MDKKPIVIISGPTCTGKTALAVSLCEKLCGEIVSADALQVYRGIEVIAASPTEEERRRAGFHLVGLKNITEEYSVCDFVSDAEKAIEDIYSRGKLPIICGGTGMYITSLINGVDFSMKSFDQSVRDRITSDVETLGTDVMYNKLKKIDPEAAQWIHPNNRVRLIRALEVIETTGMKFSDYRNKAASNESKYKSLIFFLNYSERDMLYNRINTRVDKMAMSGMEEEARTALASNPSKTVFNAIGLHEFAEGYTDVFEKIKQNTRNYCKRQLTWWRKNNDKIEIFVDKYNSINDIAEFCKTKIEEYFYE